MENAINIRYLQQGDHSAWQEIFSQYLTVDNDNIEKIEFDVIWQRMMDHNFPTFAVGAFINNDLSGIAHFVIHASTRTSKPCFYLEDLFTKPKSRNISIDGKLIDFVNNITKNNDGERLYWLTKTNHKQTQTLYDQKAQKTDFIQYCLKIKH